MAPKQFLPTNVPPLNHRPEYFTTDWLLFFQFLLTQASAEQPPLTTLLSHTQVAALPSTSIQVVPAPGAGLMVLPITAVVFANTAGGAYTNIDPAAVLVVKYASGIYATTVIANDVLITNGSATGVTDLLGSTTPSMAWLSQTFGTENVDEWDGLARVYPTSGVENTALILTLDNGGSGNLTGGDPADSLTVVMRYVIVPVP